MLKNKLALLLASGLLSACSSTTYQQAGKDVESSARHVGRLNKLAAQPMAKADTRLVPIRSGSYLGATVLKRQSGQILPAKLERAGVRLKAASPQTLLAIGDLINEATGIPVAFAADIAAPAKAAASPAAAPAVETKAAQPDEAGQLAAALDAALPKAAAGNKASQPAPLTVGLPSLSHDRMRVNYRGALSGFLNQTAAYFDIGWRYEDGRIQFSRQVTRTFQLAAMPSTLDGNASMTAGLSENGGGSGKGSGGAGGVTAGASQTAKVSIKLELWKELQEGLKGIVGNQGVFTASPSSGMVTVTGPASVVERASRQIYEINKQLLRQVTIKIEVYSVALTKDSDWRFDLNGALSLLGGKIDFGNAGAAVRNMSSVLQGVVGGKGSLSGSSAVLALLESKGDVSVVNTASLTTMSGQPVPVQVSNTQSYLESLSTTVSENNTVITPNIGTVNSGFSLNVLPKIMDDGKVLLQYSMNISTLVGKDKGFTTYEYSSNRTRNVLSLPNLDQRSFIQSGLVNNGDTLVLAGYEKLSSSTSDTGQGSADFKLLGGAQGGKQTREILVVMITPVVLDHAAELARLN
ncbi:PilN family type IVB pilus formation outer membrane protein [Chromobacterium vaccinii]|uniref:PilN family type IVB pilus formation outer membrane protein n=1 Tax=Chromobacterium vaccinii TaxID=1108595 RepID=UPI001E485540|nr:PilN family type IVB pilus formation outer membrane protein [Chromobacterium vaccinii]MCD4500495.1 PilN family type IVB pilus formation outer membrane protein [Chromobacterium vaccinii]